MTKQEIRTVSYADASVRVADPVMIWVNLKRVGLG